MSNFDFSKMYNAVNDEQVRLAEIMGAEADHQAMLEGSTLETRDILRRMEKDSAKDRKWLIIGTCASVIAAVGTIAGLVISII